jgi:DNA repair exonuclease SbcCD ATPase subunit
MKIAHLADIQIRFGSRHDEYRQVFKRLYDDLKAQKPDRIFLGGDLVHHKINMSPNSFELLAEFLLNLSKIAPTDVILGNHDLNLQQLEQGDAISPIFKLGSMFEKDGDKTAFIVTDENKDKIDYSKNAVYYFPDSGFYDIGNDVVYGVFSCKDNEILELLDKDDDKTYIGLYHGTVYGARGDNGYEQKGDNLMRLSTFKHFDMVMLGDIHEYQSFRDDASVAYCGSLIQQNYGESIDKGYLLWDTDSNSHVRKFIPNDYGFSKLVIARGENIEDRLTHLRFSHNKKKTRVHIIIEELEENFSQERENQIARKIKEDHGCEIVKVEHSFVAKDILVDDESQEDPRKQSEEYIKEFIADGTFDCDDEEVKDILKLNAQINQELGINEHEDKTGSSWYMEKIEISNIFSFPIKPTTIDFNSLNGITGLFGENYNGKSNVIKAIVWGLYKEILGGGDPKFLVNLYTDSNQGYVTIYLTIDGKKFKIHRTVKTTKHKDGRISNSYGIKYQSLELGYDGDGDLESESWENEKSDKATAEKREVESLVEEAIGDVDDFTKVTLQVQGGKDDYINQSQQPKNSLISRYLGLEAYKMRYEYANEYFKEIKKKQKEIGAKLEIELKITDLEKTKSEKDIMLDRLKTEKEDVSKNKEAVEADILEQTKKLEKVEKLTYNDSSVVEKLLKEEGENIEKYDTAIKDLEDWLSKNFKKELPFKEGETEEGVSKELASVQSVFKTEKDDYVKIDSWVKENPKKDLPNIDGLDAKIISLREEMTGLQNQLPTLRGKSCPTCGNVQQKADPEKEKECLANIELKKGEIETLQAQINSFNEITKQNIVFDGQVEKKKNLTDSLKNRKEKIDLLKDRLSLFESMKEIIEHNKKVEDNSSRLEKGRAVKSKAEKTIESLKENLTKIAENKKKEDKNKQIQDYIDSQDEFLKAYKVTLYGLDKNITEVYGDIRVLESDIKINSEKLESIKEVERMFKKYSIYLQAMHRDGIPALIIRKKLPIINSKINSILQQIVGFKVELDILPNGDIFEYFYYSEDKSDSLPLQFASGAQKFVASIAIKDALHFISTLTKPSMSIIDEGFGTLGDRLSLEIVNILQYLKNKHKNVVFVTHKNEIKDFADNIIEVTKIKKGIPQEILDANPEAGVTTLSIS